MEIRLPELLPLQASVPDLRMSGIASEIENRSPELDRLNAAEFAISTRSLRKVFRNKVAVRGLTLDVCRGEVFGFLGPNGAGKSTSVKMLLGLVTPTQGSALLLGEPIGNRAARRRVGFLPEHFRFYDWLTSEELLRAHGELCGLGGPTLRNRIASMLDLVGLTPHAGKQLREYSKGMLQRVGLAQALIHQPDVVFLDEPTSGLDPVGRRLVRDIIKSEKERGATVFLNSHLLSEVEITCDRVAFIRAGTVLEIRELKEFDQTSPDYYLRVGRVSEKVLTGLDAWAASVRVDGPHLHVRLCSSDSAPRVLEYLIEHGVEVYEFTPRRVTLEDRFLELLGVDQGL